jgi:hypothetical protein
MNMKKISKINIVQLFLASALVGGILLIIDTYISNRLTDNHGRIISGLVCGLFALPFFIVGANKSFKAKNSLWAALNVLMIVLIIGWTVWLSLIVYAFKDFQLVLPN